MVYRKEPWKPWLMTQNCLYHGIIPSRLQLSTLNSCRTKFGEWMDFEVISQVA
jgi:hypothetical protein